MRVYRWLVRLCPEALGREYGAAMEETMANRLAAARTAGRWRAAKVWWRESAGLLTLAITERWDRAARIQPVSPKPPARVGRAHQRLLAAPKAGIMDMLAQELRHAARRLRRTPVFTAAAATTLALAIAANAAIFTLVHRVVLNPLPYAESERLLALDHGIPSRNVPSGVNVMTWQLYHQLADNARTLDGIAAYSASGATLTGSGTPERVVVTRATPSLLTVLRAAPTLGRWFTEAEGTPGAAAVAVLSRGLWVRRFGADPSVVGRTILIDGVPTDVVGVMPASFTFPRPPLDLWLPAQSTRASASFLFSVQGVARLRDDASVATARAEITSLIADLARTAPNQRGIVSMALPLHEAVVGNIAGALWILLAAVGLVLLVACANIANLFLVRSESRQREVAVRRALGAGTRRLARYFLAESALLGVVGGILGFALAWAAVRLLVAFGPVNLPRLSEVRIDAVVVIFTAGLSLLAALAFGAIPLLRLAPITAALRDSGRGQTATPGQHRARQVLMTAQVALALVLLVASGLMVRSVQQLRNMDLGFDPTSTLAFGVALPERAYETRERAATTHRAILDRLNALPGVVAASAASCLPLSGTCMGNGLVVEGELENPGQLRRQFAWLRAVADGYFEAAGLRLQRGRALGRTDIDRAEPVVVIDEALAAMYFPGQDPIGKRVRSAAPANPKLPTPPWLEIVGIVSNTPVGTLTAPPMPQMYMPMTIAGGPDIPAQALIGPDITRMGYVVRSTTDPANLAGAARAAVEGVDANLAIAQVRTLQEMVDRAGDQMLFTMLLLGIAAGIALLLGAIGIYGVVSYIVVQRTGEIGLRLALGAEPSGVAALILRQSVGVTMIGVGLGLAGALAGGRLIEALLYNVSPRDPVVIGVVTLLLTGIALVACWLPARRAARLSPLEALRAD
ncbi:MAG TPA: ABC transporter permease [Vicinamibacterales bacterium]|nr:ABC transporter permease [Vicinamibacterales bacterium]